VEDNDFEKTDYLIKGLVILPLLCFCLKMKVKKYDSLTLHQLMKGHENVLSAKT
jgi:hypothetical protein